MVYRARQLRKTPSLAEVALWRMLRLRPNGHIFRRQHPIGPYVVDFCCLKLRLAVEVDGDVHDMGERPAYDLRRAQFIEQIGYRVTRVSARRVLVDAADAAQAIVALAESPLHRPADGSPPRAGED
ncbi:endonuclease domain-containing protein [Novosphingobium sp. G106]|nr:endonuclease domain-containing protein [Novosphingobium sp. G106]